MIAAWLASLEFSCVMLLHLVRSMAGTINIGQFYGGLIGAAFSMLAATWYLFAFAEAEQLDQRM